MESHSRLSPSILDSSMDSSTSSSASPLPDHSLLLSTPTANVRNATSSSPAPTETVYSSDEDSEGAKEHLDHIKEEENITTTPEFKPRLLYPVPQTPMQLPSTPPVIPNMASPVVLASVQQFLLQRFIAANLYSLAVSNQHQKQQQPIAVTPIIPPSFLTPPASATIPSAKPAYSFARVETLAQSDGEGTRAASTRWSQLSPSLLAGIVPTFASSSTPVTPKEVRCPTCSKSFSRPWLLQNHLRTHTGEKPYSCPVCNKAFADKSNLRAHVQTHSGMKPYACGRCGKSFALKAYLSKHEESACTRSLHRGAPY